MLLCCRIHDTASEQDKPWQSHVVPDVTSCAAIHLAFPEAPAAQQLSDSTESAVTHHQHSTAALAEHSTKVAPPLDSYHNHDKLIKAASSAAPSAALHNKPIPANAARSHHVIFSEAQILASPTVKPAPAPEADEDWIVIQSDASGSQPTSRTGSIISLVRVKSQVLKANGSDTKQNLSAATGQRVAPVKAMPAVKKKRSVKVPKTGRKCSKPGPHAVTVYSFQQH